MVRQVIKEKEKIVQEIREKVSRSQIGILSDFKGLKVEEMTGLRRQLQEAGAELQVVAVEAASSPGRTTSRDCSRESPVPTQSTTRSTPPVSRSMLPSPASKASDPESRLAALLCSPGLTTWSAPSSRASLRCEGCFATATSVPGRQSALMAAMTQRPKVPAPSTTTRSPPVMSAAQAACTAQAAGSTMTAASSERSSGISCSWLSCRDQSGGPATSRVGAIAGLEAGLDMAKGDPLTSSLAARGASWAEGLDPAGFTAEHGLEYGSPPVEGPPLDIANDLMAGHEGKADDVLEVAGAATVQGGEIGATDAGEAGTEPHPSRSRKIEGVDLDQFQRSDTHTFARADECRGHAGGCEPRDVAVELEGSHRTSPPEEVVSHVAGRVWTPGRRVAIARVRRGPPSARAPVLNEPAASAGYRGKLRLGVHHDREPGGLEHR